MASAYFPGDDPDMPPPDAESFVQLCRGNINSFVIGFDANAHHTVWGSRISTAEVNANKE